MKALIFQRDESPQDGCEIITDGVLLSQDDNLVSEDLVNEYYAWAFREGHYELQLIKKGGKKTRKVPKMDFWQWAEAYKNVQRIPFDLSIR
jgi:hypothetical protein